MDREYLYLKISYTVGYDPMNEIYSPMTTFVMILIDWSACIYPHILGREFAPQIIAW